jgi:hypothetical protein
MWVTRLNSFVPVSQIASDLASSPEASALQVESLYGNFLGRQPAASELTGWVNFLQSGQNFGDAEAGVLASDEFFQHAGGNVNGFLSALYEGTLGRDLDPAGSAAWNAALAGGASRYSVALGVVTSIESLQNLVTGIFHQVLHRNPDPAGLSAWVSQFQAQGNDVFPRLFGAFVGSAEAQAALASLNTPATTGTFLLSPVFRPSIFDLLLIPVVPAGNPTDSLNIIGPGPNSGLANLVQVPTDFIAGIN